jgi:hypothetical protein
MSETGDGKTVPLGDTLNWTDEDWERFANDQSEETIEEARQTLLRHGGADAAALFDATEDEGEK